MSNTSAQISSSTNKHYIMKYISISLVSLLLSFNVQAEIKLITCYPFDAPIAGGPLRYIVTAKLI